MPEVRHSLDARRSGTLAGRTRNIPWLVAPGGKQRLPYGSPSGNLGGHKRNNHGNEVVACWQCPWAVGQPSPGSIVNVLAGTAAELAVDFHDLPKMGWLGSVLDSGAKGPGFKSQSRRCRVTVFGKLFTRIVPLFTKQQNW